MCDLIPYFLPLYCNPFAYVLICSEFLDFAVFLLLGCSRDAVACSRDAAGMQRDAVVCSRDAAGMQPGGCCMQPGCSRDAAGMQWFAAGMQPGCSRDAAGMQWDAAGKQWEEILTQVT